MTVLSLWVCLVLETIGNMARAVSTSMHLPGGDEYNKLCEAYLQESCQLQILWCTKLGTGLDYGTHFKMSAVLWVTKCLTLHPNLNLFLALALQVPFATLVLVMA